jgi:hypothetical protein
LSRLVALPGDVLLVQLTESEDGTEPGEVSGFNGAASLGNVPEEVRLLLVRACCGPCGMYVCRNLGMRPRERPMGTSLRHVFVLFAVAVGIVAFACAVIQAGSRGRGHR